MTAAAYEAGAARATSAPRPAGNRPRPRTRSTLSPLLSVLVHAILLVVVAQRPMVTPAQPPQRTVIFVSGVRGGGAAPGAPDPGKEAAAAPPPPAVVPAAQPVPRPRPAPPVKDSKVPRIRAAKAAAPVAEPSAPAPPLDRAVPANAAPVAAAAVTGNGGGGPLAGGAGAGAGGVGSGRGTGTGSGDGAGTAIDAYLQDVRKRLERVKQYPLLARRLGARGTVTLLIVVGRDGRPALVRLSGSSGNDLLDEEAQAMVTRAAPFDPVPESVDDPSVRLVVPISFDLNSG